MRSPCSRRGSSQLDDHHIAAELDRDAENVLALDRVAGGQGEREARQGLELPSADMRLTVAYGQAVPAAVVWDFFRTGEEGRDAQYRSFETHIEIAKKHGIALQIHDRDAHAEVIATLLRVGAPERTVFHCFSGDVEMARIAADICAATDHPDDAVRVLGRLQEIAPLRGAELRALGAQLHLDGLAEFLALLAKAKD